MATTLHEPHEQGGPGADPGARGEEELRRLALQHLERVRRFRLAVASYALGMVVLTAVWALTEYHNSGGWPQRLSDDGRPGDWNPWILWVAIGWGFLVALDALKTYFRRPTTEAEVDREVERLRARR